MRRLWSLLLFVCALSPVSLLADEGHDHHAMGVTDVGRVSFPTSCSKQVQPAFEVAMAKLHSFWYDQARKDFLAVTQTDPKCAIAYWGIAMSLYHPLWYPPSTAELAEAATAIQSATAIKAATARERDYIKALNSFYSNYATVDHRTRALAYEKAMDDLHTKYPKDHEASIFYALSLLGTALPTDKTYANQKKAGAILEAILPSEPTHPGVAHYIIHAYDSPALAPMGVSAARSYAKIAPAVPHALHMPSHIFTRLGMWQDSIQSNAASAKYAKQYLAQGIQSGWSEQLHASDYLVYAYLQTGRVDQAKSALDEMENGRRTNPENDATTGYAVSAMPARFVIEQRDWKAAATLQPYSPKPQCEAITIWARILGESHTGALDSARRDFQRLTELRDSVASDKIWSNEVEVQRLSASAFLARAEGHNDEALKLMRDAADLEDRSEKHPVTPGRILPAREMLADLLSDLGRPSEALTEYEASLKSTPRRANGLKGAIQAADASGNKSRAAELRSELTSVQAPVETATK